MTFADLFRAKFRIALHAARANDQAATLAGLNDLYQLFADQYALRNGDSFVTKAQLSYWRDIFGSYADMVRTCGLGDRRVRKFFGLSQDSDVPSFEDYAKGNGRPVPVPAAPGPSGPDYSGLEPAEPSPSEEKADPGKDGGPDLPIEPEKPENGPVQGPSEASAEPEQPGERSAEPSFEPDSLEGFVGQQHIIKPLLKEIAIAKAEGRRYLDNILLLGNPGLGKTTLMQLIAKALGVRFECMDCAQYLNSQKSLKALQNFLMRIARENEPVVIALDEIHMLTAELQSSLLTLLNNRVYVSPPDQNGVIQRIPIENFTFIAATTDDDKVLNTIKDRCLRLSFQMVEYTSEELKIIYTNKVTARGLTITEEAIETCIPRSRGSIRYVNTFVDGMDKMLYNDEGVRTSTHITLQTALDFFREKGIDPMGLTEKDLEILRALEEDPGMSMGAETLSARVNLDPKKYLSENEPYLIRIGFITVTGRGRALTEKAVQYLKAGL